MISLGWINGLYFFVGLVAALGINVLADYLPSSRTPLRPQWGTYGWGRRKRPLLLFGVTAVLFFLLPLWLTEPVNLVVNSLYIAVLLLIIVTDLEHRLIFNVVTYPMTAVAIVGAYFVTPDENTIRLAVVGALVGFLTFGALYGLANLLYGRDRVPLGMGDVKLAMMMGAMLGFHRIFFALFWGIMLGGVITLLLLLTRRVDRTMALPYGQYLALSGIAFLIWGAEYVQRYLA